MLGARERERRESEVMRRCANANRRAVLSSAQWHDRAQHLIARSRAMSRAHGRAHKKESWTARPSAAPNDPDPDLSFLEHTAVRGGWRCLSPPAHWDGGMPGRAGGADVRDQRKKKFIMNNKQKNGDVAVMANHVCHDVCGVAPRSRCGHLTTFECISILLFIHSIMN